MQELYKKHRPKKLKQLYGQAHIIKALKNKVKNNKVPHAILIGGPSGCGKTTIARILARHVGCGKHDFKEMNCADFRGIDMVRDIRRRINQAPLSGTAVMYLIDEAHKLSNDASNAFLKLLEDTPSHVYFVLCTTDPKKLIKEIHTRCTELTVKSLDSNALSFLLCNVVEKENKKISTVVIDKIIEICEGSARKALVLLDQIIDMKDETDMLETIQSASVETQAIEIARTLFKANISWTTMAKVLKNADLTEAESIRWMVLGYAKSIMLNGGKLSNKAYLVLDAFRDHFYDSKASGLVAACYEVVCGE